MVSDAFSLFLSAKYYKDSVRLFLYSNENKKEKR